MARFYATIQGNRGPANRMGTIKSGITAHIRGWNLGVRVQCYTDREGNDAIQIFKTGGSNDSRVIECIATLLD